MFLSFLTIRNWNDKYVYTLLEFSRKPYPIPDETKKSLYPFSDQNAAKTIPFGAAHTYITYIEGSTPPGGGGSSCKHMAESRPRVLFIFPSHQHWYELIPLVI